MKKQNVHLLVAILLAILLTGCGSKTKITPETQIKADLSGSDMFIYLTEHELEITDLKVDKRQTTEEEKIDKVWVNVNAENKDVKARLYYLITYCLYNDGWQLETIREDRTSEWSYIPLSGISEDGLRSYHLPEDAQILNNEVNLESGTQTVQYSYIEHHLYCDIVHNEEMSFRFGNSFYEAGRWIYNMTKDTGSYEDWYIDGNWQYYSSSDIEQTLTNFSIKGFNPQGIAYDSNVDNDTFEVDGYYSDYNWYKYTYGTFDKRVDGPFVVQCKKRDGISAPTYIVKTGVSLYGNSHDVKITYDSLTSWYGELHWVN